MPDSAPQLTHMGVHARDIHALAAFYGEVVGLVISDQGRSARTGMDFVFMTADPDKHHQFVLVSGRGADQPSTVNQISFRVASLAAVRAAHDKARAIGATDIRAINHGNALSIYVADPEDNSIEIYCDTPWYVPQPFGLAFDFGQSDAAIMAETEALCRRTPGFATREAWMASLSARIREKLAAR